MRLFYLNLYVDAKNYPLQVFIFFSGLIILNFSSPAQCATIYGLDFPGSSPVATTIRFKFTNPQNNGLPIYGPYGNGVTYIWKAYPRAQKSPAMGGYYTTFFWGNDDGAGTLKTFLWKNRNSVADTFYGVHPYPRHRYTSSTLTDWEIAVEQQDFINGRVVYGQWYKQALVVWSDATGKHHEFYWDLPRTDAGYMVSRISPPTYGNIDPPSPTLTWGDAPWNPGKEVYSGILRGIQIYAAKLTIKDIISESVKPLSTFTGVKSIWYLNSDPTPTDISDKSGRGHNPVWVGSERPSLFSAKNEPIYNMLHEVNNYIISVFGIVIFAISIIFYLCLSRVKK